MGILPRYMTEADVLKMLNGIADEPSIGGGAPK